MEAVVSMLPNNPVRQFQLMYCVWLACTLSWNMGRTCKFYDWFYSSG
jgi:hypothetical protein